MSGIFVLHILSVDRRYSRRYSQINECFLFFLLIVDPLALATSPPDVTISTTSSSEVVIDWSRSFDLRGPLIEYELYENDILTYSGSRTNRKIPGRTPGSKLKFFYYFVFFCPKDDWKFADYFF